MEGCCVVARGLSTAHAEAVAKDLATWLCRPTLSDGTYLHQESIYDAEEAVERLRPEPVACDKLPEPPRPMVEEHFQQAWREAEEEGS